MGVRRLPSPAKVWSRSASAPAGNTPSPTATGAMMSMRSPRVTTTSAAPCVGVCRQGSPTSIVAPGSGAAVKEPASVVSSARTAQPSRSASRARADAGHADVAGQDTPNGRDSLDLARRDLLDQRVDAREHVGEGS